MVRAMNAAAEAARQPILLPEGFSAGAGFDVAVPFQGKVPFFDIAALTDENVWSQSVQEGEVYESGDRTFDAYYQLAFMAIQLLNVLIGIGFWLILGGLTYLIFARSRSGEKARQST